MSEAEKKKSLSSVFSFPTKQSSLTNTLLDKATLLQNK